MVDEVFAAETLLRIGRFGHRQVEAGVSLNGGEALVKQVMGEAGVLCPQLTGKCLGFDGLRTGGTVRVEGIAHHQRIYVMLADEAGDCLEVRAKAAAVDGEQRPRNQAEGIGDGETDTTVTDVESQDAGGHGASVGLFTTSALPQGSTAVYTCSLQRQE